MSGDRVLSFGEPRRRVPPDVCCDDMATQLSRACHMHADPFRCEDVIYWCAAFDEYGLIIHDGGFSYITITCCPWCGTRLPDSKRARWSEALQEQGFADPFLNEVPSAYETDKWYRTSDEQ